MRTTNDYNQKDDTFFFAGDLPNGGMILETPSGKEVSFTNEELHNTSPYYDKDTGKEVFYPGWVEW